MGANFLEHHLAHRSIGNPAMPVPIAGNAIDLSEFSLARISELRVAARKFASPTSILPAACSPRESHAALAAIPRR